MTTDLNFSEKDLHLYLVWFAYQTFGCSCKTIDQSKSQNKLAGENEWIHPDIVGFKLNRHEFEPQLQTFYRQMNQDIAYLYSFELKREVKLSDLKKYYFQAVSNSSWANEGYLVTAILDMNNRGLMDELDRLVQAFGIGVILLDLKQTENSQILFESKRKTELDFYTMNKLIKQKNTDFIDFIDVINSCLETNNKSTEEAVINQRMDALMKPVEINSPQVSLVEIKDSNTNQKLSNETTDWISINGQEFTRKKVSAIRIRELEVSINNLREGLVEMAKYCHRLDFNLFQTHCYPVEDESTLLFFRDYDEAWKNKKYPFILITDTTYLCTHGSSNELARLISKMGNTFGISSSEIYIKLRN